MKRLLAVVGLIAVLLLMGVIPMAQAQTQWTKWFLIFVEEKKVARCNRIGVIFNTVEAHKDHLHEAAARIGVEVIGFVPRDPLIMSYDVVGRPLSELPVDSAALSAVRAIAETLTRRDGAEVPTPPARA